MRRIAATLGVAAAAGALLVFGTAAGGEDGTYEVRAIFDNGGFLVVDEEVRVAGAKVGVVSEVDVTGVDEAAHADGSPEPGKAVVVMRIDEGGFQDFREDASCIIRPQSLLGEKFVECRITQPRAAGSEPPPPLEQIPEGEPGAGQYLLPLENNGKAVDLDLVNNIMREPYPDRFRLILNDLGASFAARGDDLEAVIERANPALRRTDEVLAILRRQNSDLERLARDGDQVLQPLAAKRDHIGNFINEAAVTAQATAERRADLEAQFQRLPGFLRELRLTMEELDAFSTSSTPVLSDLSDAAPDLTRINTALAPFADAGTTSLKSLGKAAEAAGPDLVASQPVLRDVEALAEVAGPVAKTLRSLLVSLRQKDGYRNLMEIIYNAAGAANAFDSYGHFLRAALPLNNCVSYDTTPGGGGGLSCNALWASTASKAVRLSQAQLDRLRQRADERAGLLLQPQEEAERDLVPDVVERAGAAIEAFRGSAEEEPPATEEPEADVTTGETSMRGAKALLDYLIGPQPEGGER